MRYNREIKNLAAEPNFKSCSLLGLSAPAGGSTGTQNIKVYNIQVHKDIIKCRANQGWINFNWHQTLIAMLLQIQDLVTGLSYLL